VIAALFVLEVLVAGAALAVWQLGNDSDERRGSKPPSGQRLPAGLADIRGLEPRFPSLRPAKGARPVLVAATCLDCRSGDVFGGFMGRLDPDDLPEGAEVRLLTWDGDPEAWRREHRIPEKYRIHHAQSERAAEELQTTMRVGDSGIAFVYDRRLRWYSTFHLGQLDRDGIAADLR